MTTLSSQPPYEQWDSWTEYDPKAWPRKVPKENLVIPTLSEWVRPRWQKRWRHTRRRTTAALPIWRRIARP